MKEYSFYSKHDFFLNFSKVLIRKILIKTKNVKNEFERFKKIFCLKTKIYEIKAKPHLEN